MYCVLAVEYAEVCFIEFSCETQHLGIGVIGLFCLFYHIASLEKSGVTSRHIKTNKQIVKFLMNHKFRHIIRLYFNVCLIVLLDS